MAIGLGSQFLEGLTNAVSTNGALGDQLFGSAGNDPALATSLPAEAEIRNKLNFANIRVSFPTTAGRTALTNVFSATSLSFPAYITSFTDSFTPSFTGNNVYGRTDPIPTYAGTTRNISVSLNIPCFDASDADANMKKINQFIKNIYPSYNEFKGDLIIGSPPLIRVKFANLIVDHRFPFRGLLGYVTSFSYSFDPADGFLFDKDSAGSNNLFFRSYTITFSMTVLHESVIGFKNGKFNSKTDYPYRVNNSLIVPVQQANGSRETQFGVSGDLSEAQILK
jgi:hypothetical protein